MQAHFPGSISLLSTRAAHFATSALAALVVCHSLPAYSEANTSEDTVSVTSSGLIDKVVRRIPPGGYQGSLEGSRMPCSLKIKRSGNILKITATDKDLEGGGYAPVIARFFFKEGVSKLASRYESKDVLAYEARMNNDEPSFPRQKKTWLHIDGRRSDRLIVTVSETTGIFGVSRSTVQCHIPKL